MLHPCFLLDSSCVQISYMKIVSSLCSVPQSKGYLTLCHNSFLPRNFKLVFAATPTIHLRGSCKKFPEFADQFTGTRWYNVQELLHMVNFCLRCLSHTWSPGKLRTNTMLQHTGRFRSRISLQRTIWQHWSTPHTILTLLRLIFTCSFDRNQQCSAGAFVILMT
jgi:hypothetical protein